MYPMFGSVWPNAAAQHCRALHLPCSRATCLKTDDALALDQLIKAVTYKSGFKIVDKRVLFPLLFLLAVFLHHTAWPVKEAVNLLEEG